MNSIYKELILDLYRNPKNYGRLKKPTRSALLYNPLCGDKIQIDVVIKKGKVSDIRFSGDGCALSRAAASLVTECAKNKKISAAKKISEPKLLKMLDIEISQSRLKCVLISLEAFKKTIA